MSGALSAETTVPPLFEDSEELSKEQTLSVRLLPALWERLAEIAAYENHLARARAEREGRKHYKISRNDVISKVLGDFATNYMAKNPEAKGFKEPEDSEGEARAATKKKSKR